jgi:hypothetical protein
MRTILVLFCLRLSDCEPQHRLGIIIHHHSSSSRSSGEGDGDGDDDGNAETQDSRHLPPTPPQDSAVDDDNFVDNPSMNDDGAFAAFSADDDGSRPSPAAPSVPTSAPSPAPAPVDRTLARRDFFTLYLRPAAGFATAREEQAACLLDKALHVLDFDRCDPAGFLRRHGQGGGGGGGGGGDCDASFGTRVQRELAQCCDGDEHAAMWDQQRRCHAAAAPALAAAAAFAPRWRRCLHAVREALGASVLRGGVARSVRALVQLLGTASTGAHSTVAAATAACNAATAGPLYEQAYAAAEFMYRHSQGARAHEAVHARLFLEACVPTGPRMRILPLSRGAALPWVYDAGGGAAARGGAERVGASKGVGRLTNKDMAKEMADVREWVANLQGLKLKSDEPRLPETRAAGGEGAKVLRCPLSCGKCGGKGCHLRKGGVACCRHTHGHHHHQQTGHGHGHGHGHHHHQSRGFLGGRRRLLDGSGAVAPAATVHRHDLPPTCETFLDRQWAELPGRLRGLGLPEEAHRVAHYA